MQDTHIQLFVISKITEFESNSQLNHQWKLKDGETMNELIITIGNITKLNTRP